MKLKKEESKEPAFLSPEQLNTIAELVVSKLTGQKAVNLPSK
jgi:hypothetical protein